MIHILLRLDLSQFVNHSKEQSGGLNTQYGSFLVSIYLCVYFQGHVTNVHQVFISLAVHKLYLCSIMLPESDGLMGGYVLYETIIAAS